MADAKDLVGGFGREVGTDLARALGDPQRVLQARVESLLQLNKLSDAKKEELPGDDPEKLEAVTKKMKVFRLEAQEVVYTMNHTDESLNYWNVADDGGYDCSKQEDLYKKNVEVLEEMGGLVEFSYATTLDRFCMEISECKEELPEGYAKRI